MGETAIDLGEVILQRRRANPFLPYVIVTVDGRRFSIVRPTQVAYNGLNVLLVPPKGDKSTLIPIAEVSSLEPA